MSFLFSFGRPLCRNYFHIPPFYDVLHICVYYYIIRKVLCEEAKYWKKERASRCGDALKLWIIHRNAAVCVVFLHRFQRGVSEAA